MGASTPMTRNAVSPFSAKLWVKMLAKLLFLAEDRVRSWLLSGSRLPPAWGPAAFAAK